jgi:hypothetical protein
MQISTLMGHLKIVLPRTKDELPKVGSELRDALCNSMPPRHFVMFIPQGDRGPADQVSIYARRPALWRRLVRSVFSLIYRALGRLGRGKPRGRSQPLPGKA